MLGEWISKGHAHVNLISACANAPKLTKVLYQEICLKSCHDLDLDQKMGGPLLPVHSSLTVQKWLPSLLREIILICTLYVLQLTRPVGGR